MLPRAIRQSCASRKSCQGCDLKWSVHGLAFRKVRDVTSSNPSMILASRNMSGMWPQMICPWFGLQEKSWMWPQVIHQWFWPLETCHVCDLKWYVHGLASRNTSEMWPQVSRQWFGIKEPVRDVTSNDLSTVGLQEYVRDVTSNDLSTVGLQEYVRDVTSNDLSKVGRQEHVRDLTSNNLSMIVASRNLSRMWPPMICPRFGLQEHVRDVTLCNLTTIWPLETCQGCDLKWSFHGLAFRKSQGCDLK